MTTESPTTIPEFPHEDEFQALFADMPKVSGEDLQSLRVAAKKLELDSEFQGDYLKGKFIAVIQGIMKGLRVTQSSLAEKWGKSRQYLSKLFNEDKRVNFTIETMAELASHLHHRIEIHVIDTEQSSPALLTPVRQSPAPWDSYLNHSSAAHYDLESRYEFTGNIPSGQLDQDRIRVPSGELFCLEA